MFNQAVHLPIETSNKGKIIKQAVQFQIITQQMMDSGEGQGVKRSVPLSAEEKKKLAAERKRRSRAARSAAQKKEEQERNKAEKERSR